VRGYPAAWALGDRGLFGSVEGRFRFNAGVPMVFSVFGDAGYTSRKYVQPGTTKSANLSSVGVGLLAAPAPWLTAEVIAAVPTGDQQDADGREDGRIWFSLTAMF